MSWNENYLNFKSQHPLESIGANEMRQQAFARFEAEGLPTKKDEAWKFTSLAGFKEVQWKLAESSTGNPVGLTHEQMQQISKLLPSEFTNFVFVNGELNITLSDDTEGLISLDEPNEKDFKNDNKEAVETRLTNLAQAFLQKNISFKVARNKAVEKPVQILFVQTGNQNIYLSEKLNVHLEENAQMKLIVSSANLIDSQKSALNLKVQIKAEASSNLKFVQLQQDGSEAFQFSQCQLDVDSSAQVSSLALTVGSKLTRNYYELNLNGRNANAEVYGLVIGDKDQHVDNYTFIRHAIGENNSIQQYKSILSGSSHSVFRGRVYIAQDAQKANSSQLNNNLLLTRSAQADSVPQLEIYADDVKAGHGSTVGQLNKDEIFYFLSRGINQYEAVKMLSYGYATELIYKFENPEMQKFLIQVLSLKLDKLVQNV